MSFVAKNVAPDPTLTDYPRPPPGKPTGLKVIVVGAGIGGIACAIESRLVGHEVIVFEQASKFAPLGDNIGLFPNSGRLVKRWGIHYELSKYCAYTQGLTIRKYNSDQITYQAPRLTNPDPVAGEPLNEFSDAPLYDTQRSDLHRIMIARAEELGAEVRMGARVLSYSEDDNGASVDVNGVSYHADIIVGADGVKSKARELVLGFYDAPKASGYAIFRAAYSADLIRSNPVCAHLATEGEDARTVWIGPDAHFIHGSSQGGKWIHWLFTHLDTAQIEESWSLPAKIEDVYPFLDGWDPVCKAVVSTTPPGTLIDWKLSFRPPLPTWVSPKGRIACAGDAAHPFLPTSQQGASQAVEDGVTIAHTLLLAKERGQPLSNALRAYQALRYERVKKAQQLGVDNRDMWHKIDYTKDIDPEEVKLPYALWLWRHDASAYAKENYDTVIAELATQAPSTLAAGHGAETAATSSFTTAAPVVS